MDNRDKIDYRRAVVERKKAVLRELSETEQKLLSRVLMIERQNLHMKTPHLKTELLKAVRELVK